MHDLKKLEFHFFRLIAISACFFFCAFFFSKPQPIKRSDYLVPPSEILNLSSGLKTQFADSFWLRSVQDFDHCSQPLNGRECKGKSWLYQILNLTTDFDSKFIESYFYGGLALTIIISDFEGASKIFDKGVALFPEDWKLNYVAGYHALYEEKDKAKASKLYFAAAKYGAPKWVHVLAGRLAEEGGDSEFAEQILQQMIESNQEPTLIQRLKQKIDQIKSKK